MGPGLTAKENFDPHTGEWKGMDFDIAYVRIWQSDAQGETRGLNPPITYETRLKLLANRVTCNLVPELRCMIKTADDAVGDQPWPWPSPWPPPSPSPSRSSSPLTPTPPLTPHPPPPPQAALSIFDATCARLKSLGDDYCDHIDHLCSLNNAANPSGTYGLSNGQKANMANQHISLNFGQCCIDASDPKNEQGNCRDTPHTKLPAWIRESEYFQDPKQGPEGEATGVAGTNPAGWKTYGLGLKPHLLPEAPAGR